MIRLKVDCEAVYMAKKKNYNTMMLLYGDDDCDSHEINQALNSLPEENSSKVKKTLHRFTLSVLFSVFLLPY